MNLVKTEVWSNPWEEADEYIANNIPKNTHSTVDVATLNQEMRYLVWQEMQYEISQNARS